jgi:DNA-binding transcriptional MerR regulator/effector-binding domain-containing protein
MGERRLSIGEFARMSRLSVKTLRFYHQEGLLEPLQIDARSGYRYYDLGQIERAEQIRVLRASGLPVADVRAFLERPRDRALLIEQQRGRLENQAIDTLTQLAALDQVGDHSLFTVEDINWPATVVLTVVETAPIQAFSYVIPRMFGQLYGAITAAHVRPLDAPMAIQRLDSSGDYAEDPESVRVEIAVPVSADAVTPTGLTRAELPAAPAFRTVHRGHFATMGRSWRRFADALHAREAVMGSATFEVYRVGPYQSLDPQNWITELVWIAAP